MAEQDPGQQLRDRLVSAIDGVIAGGLAPSTVRVEVVTAEPASTAAATRVFLRPIANPLSLGFLGLSFATLLFTALQLGWVPASDAHSVAIGVLAFTVPFQLISCVIGFFARDSVAATGMGVLSGVWATTAVDTLLSKPGSTDPALGLVLVFGAAAIAVPAAGAVKAKSLAAAVMFTTAIRFAVTAGYELSASTTWETAAGAAGLFLGVLAIYSALAFEVEDQIRQTVLPTFRHASGRVAMEGGLAEQVSKAANEAGVRKQL